MDDMQNLSKAERKRLKRERKKREKADRLDKWRKEKRNKKIKSWSKILVVIAILGIFMGNKLLGGPTMQVETSDYNFGTVSVRKGEVNKTIEIKNTGKKDLVFKDMETSCMCTSATLIIDGVEGPRFGMKSHGTNPQGWSARIPPGGKAYVNIYYNPKVHTELRGPVTREVTIASNAKLAVRKTIRIRLQQVS